MILKNTQTINEYDNHKNNVNKVRVIELHKYK